MIYGVTGHLGGGKSYGMVRAMLEHVRRGCVAATNIVLSDEECARYCRLSVEVFRSRIVHIDPDENGDCWTWPRGDARGKGSRRVMIVIDEAGEWFSALAADNKQSVARFASWLRQSDKRGQDVYLIVQDASILAKQGRVLCHRWLFMRDMSKWKIPKLGFGLPPPWRYEFHELEYDYTGRNQTARRIHIRDKRIFGCYDTAAMVGASAVDSLRNSSNAYDGVLTEERKCVDVLWLSSALSAVTLAVCWLLAIWL